MCEGLRLFEEPLGVRGLVLPPGLMLHSNKAGTWWWWGWSSPLPQHLNSSYDDTLSIVCAYNNQTKGGDPGAAGSATDI